MLASQLLFNRISLRALLKRKPKLHLGCGSIRLPGFINIDIKATPATDIVANCSSLDFFPRASVDAVYSHAFFEHLYCNERFLHLKRVSDLLKTNGVAVYLGIPDFQAVALAYLKKMPGITAKTFNLNEVYRYTHGDPEQVQSQHWLGQLHKTLFDADTLRQLLKSAGFGKGCIFVYNYRQEKLALNLGFIAAKNKLPCQPKEEAVRKFLMNYTDSVGKSLKII